MTPATLHLTDCHAHLDAPEFEHDLEFVLEEAAQAGVEHVVCVAEDVASAQRVLTLCRTHTCLRAALGLHPTRVVDKLQEGEEVVARELADMLALIEQHSSLLVCIGEVGLDYCLVTDASSGTKRNLTPSEKEWQMRVFTAHVELAKKLSLPLNVHSRNAGKHAIRTLLEGGPSVRGVLHAFDGSVRYGRSDSAAIQHGLFFSVPPIVARSPDFERLVAQVPLCNLLLESDAPALAPVKGERNVPANLVISLEAIARIKGVSEEDVVIAMRQNTQRLFGDPHLTSQ